MPLHSSLVLPNHVLFSLLIITSLCVSSAAEDRAASGPTSPTAAGSDTAYLLTSPNGRVELHAAISRQGDRSRLTYRVTYRGSEIIAPSSISFVGRRGDVIGEHLKLLGADGPFAPRSSWQPVYGERSTVLDNYHTLTLRYRDEAADCLVSFELRCYDEGIAFRTRIETESDSQHLAFDQERSEFRFHGDPFVWRTTNAQGLYDQVRLSQMGQEVERPLLVEVDANTCVAIAEAGVIDYATMLLQASQADRGCVVSQLIGGVEGTGSLTTPWRVVMLADSPAELLENNDIFLNLSEPCALEDTSWIRPGKVLREITLTTAGGKASIDFAVKHNFSFVEFDAGWYGHEYDDASDATTISVDPKRSPGPLDLHELIEYANERDIGIIVYVNRRALERQLEEILPLYQSWGLAGVKYGFVNTGSQQENAWLHFAIRKAAEHRLMVDIHDEYRPTGYSRTYPNLMTQEGVRGDEATPPTDQSLVSLFARSVAGSSDFTICYFADRVDEHWSHAQQLAKAVCFYSAWQFVFWYDTPLPAQQVGDQKASIIETPELEFFDRVPTTWDDTRVLQGEIGQYAVVARRSGEDWFIGAITGSEARTLSVTLNFLKPGQVYEASIYSDDESIDTPTQVRIDHQRVKSMTTLLIPLQANGGQAIRLTPVAED